MRPTAAIAAAIILAGSVFTMGPGSWAADDSVAPDALCDYCGDFTDAGVGAGTVRTTYQVGIGYADDRSDTRIAAACSGDANVPCAQVPASK